VKHALIEQVAARFGNPIPREHATSVAALCRGTRLYLYALLILHRFVRPSARVLDSPSESEIVEYAGSLAQSGAEKEALDLLKNINADKNPNANLFTAFALFAQWEYEAAVPHLKNYVAHSKITDYQRLIGRVNLVAALVIARRGSEASLLLHDLLRKNGPNEMKLLQANLFEIQAQHHLYQRRVSEAEISIHNAKKLSDSFYTLKWDLILSVFRTHKRTHLELLKKLSHEQRNWETLRENDLYEGIIFDDSKLLERSYYGTPF